MCIFAFPVQSVQRTVEGYLPLPSRNHFRGFYYNCAETKTDNIMILPVDGRVLDLVPLKEKFNTVGEELYRAIHTYVLEETYRGTLCVVDDLPDPSALAKVVDYGSYQVSISKDCRKIDWAAFKEAPKESLLALLEGKYPGYTYVVAKLRPTATTLPRHPIVFDVYRTSQRYVKTAAGEERELWKLMLPSLHVHDGTIHETEDHWDHVLFVGDGGFFGEKSFNMFPGDLQRLAPLAHELFTLWSPDWRFLSVTTIKGRHANQDIHVGPLKRVD